MQIRCHVQLDRAQIFVQEVIGSAQHDLSDVVVPHVQAVRPDIVDRQPLDVVATAGVGGVFHWRRVAEKQTNMTFLLQ